MRPISKNTAKSMGLVSTFGTQIYLDLFKNILHSSNTANWNAAAKTASARMVIEYDAVRGYAGMWWLKKDVSSAYQCAGLRFASHVAKDPALLDSCIAAWGIGGRQLVDRVLKGLEDGTY